MTLEQEVQAALDKRGLTPEDRLRLIDQAVCREELRDPQGILSDVCAHEGCHEGIYSSGYLRRNQPANPWVHSNWTRATYDHSPAPTRYRLDDR